MVCLGDTGDHCSVLFYMPVSVSFCVQVGTVYSSRSLFTIWTSASYAYRSVAYVLPVLGAMWRQ